MSKSLREIEEEFYKKYQQHALQKEELEELNVEGSKKRKLALISDIIFYVALAGVTFIALILSWGEQSGLTGRLYNISDGSRDIIILVFLVLIIVSFFLRFFINGGFGKVTKDYADE